MLAKKTKLIIIKVVTIFLLVGCVHNDLQQTSKKNEFGAARNLVMTAPLEPNLIVLMLPLSGEFATSSQAIKNGFLTAYYYFHKHHPEVKIKVVDTSQTDLVTLYQQAILDGAELIVGPLTKREVEEILKLKSLPVPLIALNSLDDYQNSFAPNLYQFGLLPQDEAIQVATRMMQEQHDRAAIILPQSGWAKKIFLAFKKKYEELGGRVVVVLPYNFKENLGGQICNFLAKDAAKLCMPQKRRDKKQHDSYEIMRRQDINGIFLIAPPHEARQIVPLLKFYYAADLPTYATSVIYSGISRPSLDRDLDGIYFCDMPWVLLASGSLNDAWQMMQQKISSFWHDSFIKEVRLYALGIDAYQLALGLNGLLQAPEIGFNGASGMLYLDSYNHIYRELKWAKVENGVPVVLP